MNIEFVARRYQFPIKRWFALAMQSGVPQGRAIKR